MTKVGRLFLEEAEQMAAEQARFADARRLVNSINSLISKGYNVDEACDLLDVTPEEYEKARKLLDSDEVFA